MKTLFTILITLITTQSFAECPRLLCSGDTVVSKNGFSGKVIGVNPHTEAVAIKWHTDNEGYSVSQRSTFNIEKVAIGRGCLSYYCVGNTVASYNGFLGVIIGVNPHTSSAAVKWHTDNEGYSVDKRSTLKLRSLSIARGCVLGFCTKDTVISGNGFTGKVLGVNPYTLSAAVEWHTDSEGYSVDSRSTFEVKNLFNEKFCADYSPRVRLERVHIQIKTQGSKEYGKFEFPYYVKN